MEISYTPMDLLLYLLLYSFIAWGIEVCIVAVRDRRFVNRGFLNLPVNLPYGIAAALLLPALATLKNVFLEYGMIWVVLCLVQALSNQFLKGISRKYASADYCSGTAPGRKWHPLTLSCCRRIPAILSDRSSSCFQPGDADACIGG